MEIFLKQETDRKSPTVVHTLVPSAVPGSSCFLWWEDKLWHKVGESYWNCYGFHQLFQTNLKMTVKKHWRKHSGDYVIGHCLVVPRCGYFQGRHSDLSCRARFKHCFWQNESKSLCGTQNPQWWSKQATPLNYPGTGAVTKVEGWLPHLSVPVQTQRGLRGLSGSLTRLGYLAGQLWMG